MFFVYLNQGLITINKHDDSGVFQYPLDRTPKGGLKYYFPSRDGVSVCNMYTGQIIAGMENVPFNKILAPGGAGYNDYSELDNDWASIF